MGDGGFGGDGGGGHAGGDGGAGHGGHHGGGHHGSDGGFGWMWGVADDSGTTASSAGQAKQTYRMRAPLALSALAGVGTGLIGTNQQTTLVGSLLSGVAVPYVAMHHKPSVADVGISVLTSVAVGAVTQRLKQGWKSAEEQKREEPKLIESRR